MLVLHYSSSRLGSKENNKAVPLTCGRAAVEEDTAAGPYQDSWPKSTGLEHIILQARTKPHDC
jgi:hypothetical protein